MPWLIREEEVLAALAISGGLGAVGDEGAVLARGPVLVHTCGRRPLDVAWCTVSADGLAVRRVATLRPWRMGRPCPPAAAVVVAPAGAFERWHLRPGDHLEVEGTAEPA